MSGWSSVVSTSTTFEPSSASCLIGAYIALVSVGAISTASGFLAATALTIGVCSDGVELVRALEVERDAELLGLGLGSAVHRDVELVALDARDERHLVVLLARCRRLLRAADAALLSSLPQAATTERERRAGRDRSRFVRAMVGTDLLLLVWDCHRWYCDRRRNWSR